MARIFFHIVLLLLLPPLVKTEDEVGSTFKRQYGGKDLMVISQTFTNILSVLECGQKCLKTIDSCEAFRFDRVSWSCDLSPYQAWLTGEANDPDIHLYEKVLDDCDDGWIRNPVKRTCIKLVTTLLTGSNAEQNCIDMNASLVTLNSDLSWNWMINLLEHHDELNITGALVGASFQGEDWRWFDGSAVDMGQFLVNQPDGTGSCVQILEWNGDRGLDDASCSSYLAASICEKDVE